MGGKGVLPRFRTKRACPSLYLEDSEVVRALRNRRLLRDFEELNLQRQIPVAWIIR